ncbi:unnamed protein product [Closterium sp. NIES-65]|nr:unnamed protein product [Closterium sp. NIES-65]
MFKKFSNDEVAGQNQLKASVQRKIRQSIAEEVSTAHSPCAPLAPPHVILSHFSLSIRPFIPPPFQYPIPISGLSIGGPLTKKGPLRRLSGSQQHTPHALRCAPLAPPHVILSHFVLSIRPFPSLPPRSTLLWTHPNHVSIVVINTVPLFFNARTAPYMLTPTVSPSPTQPPPSPSICTCSPNHVSIVVMNNVPLFFNVRDGPFMPTLRLLHQLQVDRGAIKPANPHLPLFANTPPLLPPFPLPPDPDMMRKMQVDRGAIKFVMSGANIMCPGLTSPGGKMDDGIPTDSPVAIFAEGKENALAIGYTKMSSDDIRKINKGIGVDLMHYLNDGLWKMKTID